MRINSGSNRHIHPQQKCVLASRCANTEHCHPTLAVMCKWRCCRSQYKFSCKTVCWEFLGQKGRADVEIHKNRIGRITDTKLMKRHPIPLSKSCRHQTPVQSPVLPTIPQLITNAKPDTNLLTLGHKFLICIFLHEASRNSTDLLQLDKPASRLRLFVHKLWFIIERFVDLKDNTIHRGEHLVSSLRRMRVCPWQRQKATAKIKDL